MPLQHHSAFGPAVYSPHADYLLKNVFVYPQKYLPAVHIPLHTSPDVAIFDSDDWHPHFNPHQYSLSPPRKHEELPAYPAIPTYPPSHELLIQQHPHRNYGLYHHHQESSQPFALFEIPRSSFEQQSHQPVLDPVSPYPTGPLPSNPTVSNSTNHMSWLDDERSSLSSLELDTIPEDMDMDASAAAVVSGIHVIAPIDDSVVEGEDDAEGEEDHLEEISVSSTTASTSRSDKDFEDLTSEEDEHEEADDDDDDEFVLNPRQRQHRSIFTVDSRRSSRVVNDMNGSASANAATHSELPSDGFVRRRTRPSSSSLGAPVPVPNLTKKSRGRRVPTVSSLEDLRSAASGAGKKRQNSSGKIARMYLCDVEGCGKCFARGEHLKRHVRSIHTYEKPHKCPYPGCGKDFSRHDNLGQHMRVHKDYKPPASSSMRRKAQQA